MKIRSVFFKDQVSVSFEKIYTSELHVHPCMEEIPEWAFKLEERAGDSQVPPPYVLPGYSIPGHSYSTPTVTPCPTSKPAWIRMFRPDFSIWQSFMIRKISKWSIPNWFLRIKQFSMVTICNYSHTIFMAGKYNKLAMPTRLSLIGTVFYSQL